jgi:hypothetical protein
MNNPLTKMDRIWRRTLVVLALTTAVGSTGLAAGGTADALLGTEITGTEAAAGLPLEPLPIHYVFPANPYFLSRAEGSRTPALRRAKSSPTVHRSSLWYTHPHN